MLTLASQRIYILPTAAGFIYAAMLVTMLAGAMNYNNNLAFALTFLLAGIGIVTIYHTHRTLAGLQVHYLGAEPVFAGDPLEVRISLVNQSSQPRDEIFLDWQGSAEVAGGVQPLRNRIVGMPLTTRRRGPLALPALRLSTRAPLGLMRAWAWVHLEPRPIVYPRPTPDRIPPRLSSDNPADGLRREGDDDFAGLRDYQPGDSPRRIAWRSYAKTSELLVREFRGGSTEDVLWIDWQSAPPGDVELRISRLTRMVVDAFEGGRRWGLSIPGTRIGPDLSLEHLHQCLRCLATAGLTEERAT